MKSFVVRIQEDSCGGESLRGVVDEVSTGQQATFSEGEELLAVLSAGIRAPKGERCEEALEAE